LLTDPKNVKRGQPRLSARKASRKKEAQGAKKKVIRPGRAHKTACRIGEWKQGGAGQRRNFPGNPDSETCLKAKKLEKGRARGIIIHGRKKKQCRDMPLEDPRKDRKGRRERRTKRGLAHIKSGRNRQGQRSNKKKVRSSSPAERVREERDLPQHKKREGKR